MAQSKSQAQLYREGKLKRWDGKRTLHDAIDECRRKDTHGHSKAFKPRAVQRAVRNS